MFEVSGCHIWAFRPAKHKRPRKNDPQYKSMDFHQVDSRLTVGRCTLHSQYLSWSECHATGWWQLLPASAETRDVFTYGHGEPSHASENRLDPCAPQPMAKHEFRVSFVICPTRVSYRLRFSEKKRKPLGLAKYQSCRMLHTSM